MKKFPSCLSETPVVSASKGARIFEPGAPCETFLYVTSGAVRVALSSETGKSIFLYRVCPGETCVLTTSCLMSGDAYSAEAVAEENVEARAVPKARFLELLNGSEDFRSLVFSTFSARLTELLATIDAVAFAPLAVRLAGHLLESGASTILTTHEHLAGELGTAREVVSRKLGEWESAGLILRKRGAIEILNRSGIEKFTL